MGEGFGKWYWRQDCECDRVIEKKAPVLENLVNIGEGFGAALRNLC
jgi:hypothetical protein